MACGDDMWKEAPEDILLEIFIRLPDSQTAVRTATVCHKWHSVISHNPQFIPRFKSHHHQHQHRYPLPYAIFFRKDDTKPEFAGPQYFQPICKLFSDQESKFCTSPNFLDFMPYSPMVIRGSCNDLLLLSPGPRWSTDLYICNPITKQFVQLPEIPREPDYLSWNQKEVAGHALVCMPGPSSKSRFKVVELKNTYYHNYSVPELPEQEVQTIMLFCSESRKWETRHFHYPFSTRACWVCWLHGVACNGILYWLEFERFGVNRAIYLDMSNDHCGAIDFPDGYCKDSRYARVQIGVVRVCGEEELRLLQVVLTTARDSTVDLKVWKLSHEKEWVLVHHKNKLERPKQEIFQALPFVHPTNGDVVFMIWSQKVFQCNLKDSTTELIGELQEPLATVHVDQEAPFDRLLQFPVVHTHFWPTQILT